MNIAALRAMLGFVRPYTWTIPALVILGLASSLAEGIGIGLIVPMLNVMVHGTGPQASDTFLEAFRARLLGYGDEEKLLIVGAAILGLLLIKALLVFATVSLSAWTNGRVAHNIRRRLFSQMLTVEYGFLIRSDQGRLVNAFENQVWRIMNAMVDLSELIASLCMVFVFAVLLLVISWPLTIAVVALGATVSLLIGRPMIRRVHHLGNAAVSAATELSKQVIKSLGGMRAIRAFGREPMEQIEFDMRSDRTRALLAGIERTERVVPAVLEVVYAPIFLVAVLMAWKLAIEIPTLLAFLFMFYRVQPHVRAVDQTRARLAGFAGSIREVADLLDPTDKPSSATGSVPFDHLRDRIEFRQVSFEYRTDGDERLALDDVSFAIRAREVTAIVGASGSGKSTAINLLYRFFEPSKGAIFIDGRPLAELDTGSWRKSLALAGQDVALLNGTVLENITYGAQEATNDDVLEASKSAAAEDFIQFLPDGYNTEIGDGGIRLSEGQRQRIGLARALLRQPDILILDEATNALDGLTEQVVSDALDRLAGKITVLMIAHRLSTIRKADHVLVLKEGRLLEEGTPTELLEKGGAFNALYAAQFWRPNPEDVEAATFVSNASNPAEKLKSSW